MIPSKSNFKFQELTPITGVKPYVIRFWETEFDEINPVNSDSGQRLYARKDVEAILKIKKLLFDEKMTIQEAKIAIKSREIMIDLKSTESDKLEDISEDQNQLLVKNSLISSLQLIQDIKNKRHW
jgi:DNA-binding transcriptional MerR regulator